MHKTITLKRFASPKKDTARNVRAKKQMLIMPPPPGFTSSRKSPCLQSTPPESRASSMARTPISTTDEESSMVVSVGEPLLSDLSYGVHELPSEQEVESDLIVPLQARLEFLESERSPSCSRTIESTSPRVGHFCVELIANNDRLISFYTGFHSYSLFLRFFEFLGPAEFSLNYWGDSEQKTTRRRKQRFLTSLNPYFLTLIKLRLELRERDLAYRFGISTSLVSKFFITWISFMYHHLKEINWSPATEQVAATLPQEFLDKYATTYLILDATEIFLQTPSDLQTQSSTWSSYKHHNTAKALVGCTPNGGVSFVSDLYVGSISDVELTKSPVI